MSKVLGKQYFCQVGCIRHPGSGTLTNKGYHTLGQKKGQGAIAVMQVR